jgi:general secretion pathway protein F
VFPPTFSAMVRAGESSGTLELVLDRLAEFSEQQQALRRQIQSSLAYPILIFLVSMGVIFFLMSYVVPKVTQIFLDFEQALPLPTLALMEVSSFIHAYWWLFPAAIVLGFYGCRRFAATERGRSLIHAYLLKLPVVGPLLHHVILSRFSHTLGTLLKNEVSLLQSLQIVRSVVSNTVLQHAVDAVVKEVREGSDLARPMAQRSIFPPTMVQLVAAGEQSGQLDAMFLKVAQNSEEFVTNKLAMLTSLLELRGARRPAAHLRYEPADSVVPLSKRVAMSNTLTRGNGS